MSCKVVAPLQKKKERKMRGLSRAATRKDLEAKKKPRKKKGGTGSC